MTRTKHYAYAELSFFVTGDLVGDDRRKIAAHLLSGCETCKRRLRQLLTDREDKAIPLAATAFLGDCNFISAEDEQSALDRLVALGTWNRLRAHPIRERRALVRSDASLWTPATVDVLLDAAYRTVVDDPIEALSIARLAWHCALRVDIHSAPGGPRYAFDLTAEAIGCAANACRVAGRYRRSERYFMKAFEMSKNGNRNPLVEARLFELDSSLLIALGEWDMAMQGLVKARRLYGEQEERHREGRVLIKIGNLEVYRERYIDAFNAFGEAEIRIDPIEEPRWETALRHSVAWALCDSGRPRDALAFLESYSSAFRCLPVGDALRYDWLRGRILLALRMPEAEPILRRLLRAWDPKAQLLESTLTALDLARCLSSAGRSLEAVEIVREVLPRWEDAGLLPESLAAWGVVLSALDRRQTSLPLFSAVARFLRAGLRNPLLLFSPPIA